MAPIDHHCQLHGSCSSVVRQSIERSSDCASGEQDVVDQDHRAAVEVAGNVGDGLGQHRPKPNVVSVERNIETTDWDFRAVDQFKGIAESGGKRYTPGLQTDDNEVIETLVSLDDFVGPVEPHIDAQPE